MASKRITRLARLEGRTKAIHQEVFTAYLGLLTTDDLTTIIDIENESPSPLRPPMEAWLISMLPVPAIREDLWRKAVTIVLDPVGIYDARESAALAKELKALGEQRQKQTNDGAEAPQ